MSILIAGVLTYLTLAFLASLAVLTLFTVADRRLSLRSVKGAAAGLAWPVLAYLCLAEF